MDIYVQSQIRACAELILSGKKQEISVVISPLNITQNENTLKATGKRI